jgi:thioesterase domain-containing protein
MNLARHMGQDQPFYALQAKGLDGVEEPFDNIKAMAAHYIEAIRTVQPRGPYALGGLCIGGLVAFEMAQQLREKGEDVAVVALLDSLAVNSGYRKNTLAWKFLHFIKDLPSWLMGSTQLNRLQWIDLIQLKIRMAKISFSSGGARHQFIKEMGDLFHFSEQHRKIARAQQRALREYTPQLYPGCLTLFRARMQPLLSSHHPDKGWSRLAGGGLKIKVVPGNHLAMLQEPHVKILAKELRACLERSVSSTVEARCARNDELGQMVLT